MYKHISQFVKKWAGFLGSAASRTKTTDESVDYFAVSAGLLRQNDQIALIDQVAMAYQVFLKRPIDSVGYEYWYNKIKEGSFSHKILIESLLSSPEYLMLHRVPFHQMVHLARQSWVAQLPPFDNVLDIGGSSPNISQGALIELGYSHRPKRIVIFDLPPEKQYWGAPKYPQDRSYKFAWGTVEYIHGSAEAISDCVVLKDERFDLIFMGEVLEHIEPSAIPSLLRWIRNHLNPEGSFIFDTPNRNLTRLQIPDRFIDADHKIEYTPNQICKLLSECGLIVDNAWGLLPMPESASSGQFNPLEVYDQPLVSDDFENSYLFAFACKKI